jgi:hypothetical protein
MNYNQYQFFMLIENVDKILSFELNSKLSHDNSHLISSFLITLSNNSDYSMLNLSFSYVMLFVQFNPSTHYHHLIYEIYENTILSLFMPLYLFINFKILKLYTLFG